MRNILQLCLNDRERYSCTDFRCRCHPIESAASQPVSQSQPVMRISRVPELRDRQRSKFQAPMLHCSKLRLFALKLQMTRNLSSLLLQTTRSCQLPVARLPGCKTTNDDNAPLDNCECVPLVCAECRVPCAPGKPADNLPHIQAEADRMGTRSRARARGSCGLTAAPLCAN